jgi:acyl-CoA reductase-like NAD-dependent aldehyde dehydrogenase
MPDELPADVFTELGRVTWAAIKLEDYVEGLCSQIDPANPRTDKRQVSAKIKDARRVLAARTPSATRDEAAEWLERARQAMERRNAALHATPIVWMGRERAEDRLGLGEMPRNGRPYAERPLTVESLSELRSVLENAAVRWQELVIALAAESRSQAPPSSTSTG